MELSELKRICLLARHYENQLKNTNYHTETSLEDLSSFIDRATQNLHWELSTSPLQIAQNNLKEAQDKIRNRHGCKTEKSRKSLFDEVVSSFSMGLASHAGHLNSLIQEREQQ